VIGLLSPERSAALISAEALGASQYVETVFGLKVGRPPALDLDAERRVQEACREAIRSGLVDVAHDCSEGGLAVAIAEMCIAGDIGAQVSLDALAPVGDAVRTDALLFGEHASRILVALPRHAWGALNEIAAEKGVALTALGSTGGSTLTITQNEQPILETEVVAARQAWESALR
jgi:phosphoribosylformylglycinamidine (FGAM) synthase-like enzyme